MERLGAVIPLRKLEVTARVVPFVLSVLYWEICDGAGWKLDADVTILIVHAKPRGCDEEVYKEQFVPRCIWWIC